jgi:hypothetical protein
VELLERFREHYDDWVDVLLDGTDPRSITKKERCAIKDDALKCALENFPVLQQALEQRKMQMSKYGPPPPKPITEEQQLGAAVVRQIAYSWRCRLADSKTTEKEPEVACEKEPDGRLPERYKLIADAYNVLPPDGVTAALYGCTASNVGHVRRVLVDEGYVFEKMSLPAEDKKYTYHWVVKSRPEPEPEVDTTEIEQELLLNALKKVPPEKLAKLLMQALE